MKKIRKSRWFTILLITLFVMQSIQIVSADENSGSLLKLIPEITLFSASPNKITEGQTSRITLKIGSSGKIGVSTGRYTIKDNVNGKVIKSGIYIVMNIGSISKTFSAYVDYKPTEIGTHELQAYVVDADGATTSLKVSKESSSSSSKSSGDESSSVSPSRSYNINSFTATSDKIMFSVTALTKYPPLQIVRYEIEDKTEGKKISSGVLVFMIVVPKSSIQSKTINYKPDKNGEHNLKLRIYFGTTTYKTAECKVNIKKSSGTGLNGYFQIDSITANPDSIPQNTASTTIIAKVSMPSGIIGMSKYKFTDLTTGKTRLSFLAGTPTFKTRTISWTISNQKEVGTHTIQLEIDKGKNGKIIETCTFEVTEEIEVQVEAPDLTFSADPSEINIGQSSELSWTTTNSTKISISQGVDVSGKSVSKGSVTVSPVDDTTYVLTAIGDGGTVTKEAKVTVKNEAIPLLSLSLSSDTIDEGDPVTLSWVTSNVNSLSITNVNIDDKSVSLDSIILYPEKDTTYTATATGSGGTTSDSVSVTVNEDTMIDVSVSIDATSTTINSGESTRLLWESTNANSVVINNGINTDGKLSGYEYISPLETTTYVATATGDGGVATDEIVIMVNSGSGNTTITLDLSTDTINEGGSAILSWKSNNAHTVTISDNVETNNALNGSAAVSPATTTIYVATAIGASGTVTDQATLTVNLGLGEEAIRTEEKGIGTNTLIYIAVIAAVFAGIGYYIYLERKKKKGTAPQKQNKKNGKKGNFLSKILKRGKKTAKNVSASYTGSYGFYNPWADKDYQSGNYGFADPSYYDANYYRSKNKSKKFASKSKLKYNGKSKKAKSKTTKVTKKKNNARRRKR